MDVRPTAASICRRDVVLARPEDSFLDVYRYLVERNFTSLPVVDADGRVLGMPTLADILNLLVPGGKGRPLGDRRVHTSLDRVRAVLGARVECGERLDSEEDLVILVAASSLQTNTDGLARLGTEHVLVVVGDRPDIHRQVVEKGVRAVLLTGGFGFDLDLVRLARERGVALLRCTQDTATTVGLIRCSRRVSDVVDPSFLSFTATELVPRIVDTIQDSTQPLFPVLDEETGTLFGVFSKSDLVELPRTRLVLVDHNEYSQAVTGADEAEILEVIDHHRLSGNLVSREPVRFINEPVGSTSTIVAQFFRVADLAPSRESAICLMAGLVSDTLKLSSPTTTDTDRQLLPWLAKIAGLDVDEFTRGFFEAGSILRELPPSAVIGTDRKEYLEAGWRVSISQIEELGLEAFDEREKELQAALASLRTERTLDFACLLVTDITAACSSPTAINASPTPSPTQGSAKASSTSKASSPAKNNSSPTSATTSPASPAKAPEESPEVRAQSSEVGGRKSEVGIPKSKIQNPGFPSFTAAPTALGRPVRWRAPALAPVSVHPR
jgi:manganese-dependent inorganic pyrophosphatase